LKDKPQDLVTFSRYGKVPLLVDGEAIIYESAIINEYLDEKYPDVPLRPTDLFQRARARIWIDFCSSRLHAAGDAVRKGREPAKAKERLQEHLQTLEHELADRPYLTNQYSLADITFIPFYVRRERYQADFDHNTPNLKRWMEELVARPAVASTL
jgi:glutathione S-transferase